MSSSAITDPTKRHEFVLLFDARDSNPNGDPDNDNLPRIDPQTGLGLVTDVAIKRKIRDYIGIASSNEIFIQSNAALNTLKAEVANGLAEPLSKDEREGKRAIPRLTKAMCDRYYDIRMFGAVLSTGDKDDRLNAGQVRGPVQVTFGRSLDPVASRDLAISRQARTTEERMLTGTTELGRKALLDYAVYRAHGFYNPFLAKGTGVSDGDLDLLWKALADLFTFNRSASKGEMTVRELCVFTHDSELGNAPAHKLFDLIHTPKSAMSYPRSWSDYTFAIPDTGDLTDRGFPGVRVDRLV